MAGNYEKKNIKYKGDAPSVSTIFYESLIIDLKVLGISDIIISPVFRYVIWEVG